MQLQFDKESKYVVAVLMNVDSHSFKMLDLSGTDLVDNADLLKLGGK